MSHGWVCHVCGEREYCDMEEHERYEDYVAEDWRAWMDMSLDEFYR